METMSGFMLLTFWLCAGVNYIMLRNMSKHQKGLLLGVTLPPEADALPEVQAIVKQYRTRLGTLCLVCAALSVPLAFVQETAIALTLWMLFFFAGLALPFPLNGNIFYRSRQHNAVAVLYHQFIIHGMTNTCPG